MAKKFFYVCGGLLMLALAWHFGASTATAQAPSNSIVAAFCATQSFSAQGAITANGDAWYSLDGGVTWTRRGNVFGGIPVPTNDASWGQVKARYR